MWSLQMTASGDLSVCMWDITCACCLRKFHWHRNSVKSVDVNRDDDCKFTCSELRLSSRYRVTLLQVHSGKGVDFLLKKNLCILIIIAI